MSYLFNEFERIVFLMNNPNGDDHPKLICSLIDKELVRFKEGEVLYEHKLLKLAGSRHAPKILKHNIRLHQSSSIRIVNELERFMLHEDLNSKQTDTIHQCIDLLINLLDFLCTQFKSLFDEKEKIPNIIFKRYQDQIKALLPDFENYDNGLIDIKALYYPFIEFQFKKTNTYTFRKACYLFETLNKVNESLVKSGNSIKLIYTFIAYNLNSAKIYDYIIELIVDQLGMRSCKSERLRRLKYLDKLLTQIVVLTPKGLKSQKPTLKDSIGNWIQKEISFYNYDFHLQSGLLPEVPRLNEDLKQTRIKTNLSVGQLACFVKQLIEVGVIEAKNQNDILKHFSSSYPSKNSTDISEKSFTNKFFNVDNTTSEKTRQIFLKLFRSIN